MTYKTRQEVLRAAADWMDVCEKVGVEAVCKWNGEIGRLEHRSFLSKTSEYEFPLALLEGKEVWIGSELWNVPNNFKFTVKYAGAPENYLGRKTLWGGGLGGWLDDLSWNPPKPKTVMVELDLEIVEHAARLRPDISPAFTLACKKALEKL